MILKNNKGFSIVELLAIIVISSLVLMPLLRSFVRNIEINDLEHTRRSGVNIAEGTLYGFNKITYSKLFDLLQARPAGADHYLVFDENNCTDLIVPVGSPDTTDADFCTSIFSAIHNNLELDAATFKVYIYDYNMDVTEVGQLTGNTDIPVRVRNDITDSNIGDGSLTSLLRITVWINQSTDPDQYVVISGLIYDE